VSTPNEGRVAIVTGGGRGFGRCHALELADQGAAVVVNDLGVEVDGAPQASGPAEEVVAEIRAAGGRAIANGEDVASSEGAARLIAATLSEFGRLDVLVNNAGVLRDRMLVNLSDDDWDAVIRVHLRGTFCPTRQAAQHWRAEAKAGRPVDARVINTSSAAGLFGNLGQANYSTAKMGILGFTIETAAELGRYGVTVNAIAPGGRTRMTAQLFSDMMELPEGGFDAMAPENVAPLVAWLASPESRDITGRVFEVYGGTIGVANGWTRGPHFTQDHRFTIDEVGPTVVGLLRAAPDPVPVMGTTPS
jgi:NAD(P)-dependent dehydrogenase (short-subunit alcohol dehydrogenase family)